MDKEIKELLTKYSSLEYDANKNRIVCKWSGHEIPLKKEAVLNYVNGNKYKHLLSKSINNEILKNYSEFLGPTKSKNPIFQNQLFCKLTLKHVNKQSDHVQLHFNGRKFQKAYEYWLHCQQTNTKFVPFCKQKKKRSSLEDADEEDEMMFDMDEDEDKEGLNEDNESVDSMSDLYPDMFELIENDQLNGQSMELSDETNGHETKKPNKRKFDSKMNKKNKVEPSKKKLAN